MKSDRLVPWPSVSRLPTRPFGQQPTLIRRRLSLALSTISMFSISRSLWRSTSQIPRAATAAATAPSLGLRRPYSASQKLSEGEQKIHDLLQERFETNDIRVQDISGTLKILFTNPLLFPPCHIERLLITLNSIGKMVNYRRMWILLRHFNNCQGVCGYPYSETT